MYKTDGLFNFIQLDAIVKAVKNLKKWNEYI